MATHIITCHCTNPDCTRDYYAQREFVGSLEGCAECFKEIYGSRTNDGYVVTDAHDDELDPDTIADKVMKGELSCIKVNTMSEDVYTIIELV